MQRKIGFIGCGNMAKAMIGGLVKSDYTNPDNIYASNRSMPSLEEMKNLYNIHITLDNLIIAKECEIVFLSVTPDLYPSVIEQIKETI